MSRIGICQVYVYREGEWQDIRPNLLKAVDENSYAEVRFRSTQDITFRNGKILLSANENIFEGDGIHGQNYLETTI